MTYHIYVVFNTPLSIIYNMPKKNSKIKSKPNIRGQYVLSILDVVRKEALEPLEIVNRVTLKPPYMSRDTALDIITELLEAKMIRPSKERLLYLAD